MSREKWSTAGIETETDAEVNSLIVNELWPAAYGLLKKQEIIPEALVEGYADPYEKKTGPFGESSKCTYRFSVDKNPDSQDLRIVIAEEVVQDFPFDLLEPNVQTELWEHAGTHEKPNWYRSKIRTSYMVVGDEGYMIKTTTGDHQVDYCSVARLDLGNSHYFGNGYNADFGLRESKKLWRIGRDLMTVGSEDLPHVRECLGNLGIPGEESK